MQAKNWYAVSVLVDSAASEAIEFGFNELDADGTEIDGLVNKTSATQTVVGYFNAKPDIEAVRSQMESALVVYGISKDAIREITFRTIENADWLAEWKKHWNPTIVGKFLIAAPWHELDEDEKIVIRIEPNMAFGTGTHETTRLCLAAIDDLYKSGESFLDVGTGTGILAIAAARSNFRSQRSDLKSQILDFRSLAIDNDPDAIKIAKENADANGVGGMIDFRTGQLGSEQTKFDFVCANLTLDVILPILPQLIEKTDRILVLSGILAEQENTIIAELNKLTAAQHTIDRDGEWIAVMVRKSGIFALEKLLDQHVDDHASLTLPLRRVTVSYFVLSVSSTLRPLCLEPISPQRLKVKTQRSIRLKRIAFSNRFLLCALCVLNSVASVFRTHLTTKAQSEDTKVTEAAKHSVF